MDRVRRTLCFASKTIAFPVLCLTTSLINAQQSGLQQATMRGDTAAEILQVAANETPRAAKSGLLQVFTGAMSSGTSSSGSSASGGLLGSVFGVGSTSESAPPAKPTKTPASNSKVPMPPSMRSDISSSSVQPVSTQATTQQSKADWSGIPYHSPNQVNERQTSVPLSDPDPSAIATPMRDSLDSPQPRQAVSEITLPAPPTSNPTPATQPTVPSRPTIAVSQSSELESIETSSRRSSRRTAASLTNSSNSASIGSPEAARSEAQKSLERVVDLVPKVTRKPLATQSDTSTPHTPVTVNEAAERGADDLQPLPPATVSSEDLSDENGSFEKSEVASPKEDSRKLSVTAVSIRTEAEASEQETESAETKSSGENNVSDQESAEVVATEGASETTVGSPAMPRASVAADRLPRESISSSNDLRGQSLDIAGGLAGSSESESMQLSPPKTPDFGVHPSADDSTNQMRGQAGNAGKETGTTSELPGIRVTTKGPDSIMIRQDAEYAIVVENRGQIDADGVLIRAMLPDWADLRGQVASRGEIGNVKEGSAERLIWEIGRLPAGASETMKLKLVASRSGTYDLDIDWTLLPQKSVARVQVREPRLNLTIEGPDEVVFGESQTYKVRVLNPGNGTASNVSFTLSPNSATPQTQRIGDIPPGKEAQFDIELTAKDHGDLKIHGLAAGDLALRAEAEKTISVAAAKLEAVLTGPQVKYQNTEGLYSLQLQNHGNASSDQIQASLRLPSGVNYLGGIEGAEQEDQLLRWDLEQLPPGAVRTYQFQCNMDRTGEHLFTFDCRGTAAGAAAVSIATRVESIADLVLTVSDPVAPAPIGTDVPYEIIIRNRGSKEATDVRAIAQFSHGVEPHRIEGQSGEVMTGQVLFDAIPKIGAGEEIRVKVIAQADRPGHHRFRAEIRSGDTVLVAEEATHYMSPEGERVSRRSSERLRR